MADQHSNTTQSRVSCEAFNELMWREMPLAEQIGLRLERISTEEAVMRAEAREGALRPGGTVAGPVMMALADAVIYAAILARIGMQPLTVTTNLNINFMRKPPPGDLLATASVLKLGRRLAVCDCRIESPGLDTPLVAHATATYAIPADS